LQRLQDHESAVASLYNAAMVSSAGMKGVFVTGTDTDVGKTLVAGALLAVASSRINAVPMKPIQTGCQKFGDELIAPDLDFMLTVSGLNPNQDEKALMCPYRFEPACSPHLAALRADEIIDIDHILQAFNALLERHEFVVVEGAGGIIVPIYENITMLDLMIAMDLAIILVSRPGLGTINHTLLSLRAIQQAGLNVLGVVFNHTKDLPQDFIEEDNKETIQRLAATSTLATVPYIPNLNSILDPSLFLEWTTRHLPQIPAVVENLIREAQ